MDIISHLPDDLLLRILSLVQTKTAVDAQLLSKRWRNLWKKLPSLYYDYTSYKSDSHLFTFIHRTLLLLESQVLESLYLRIVPTGTSSEVSLKGELLAKRPLRELNFVTTNPRALQIKKGIYQLHTLVILRLEGFTLEDDYGDLIPLPSLKVLQLFRVRYSSDRSLSNLLSSLPSLEDLSLDRCFSVQHAQALSIKVPCLQRLTVVQCPDSCRSHLMVLNVDAPSLKYLNVEDYWRNVSFSEEKMEDLIEADVSVTYIDTEKLLRAVISAKRLSLCLLTSKIPRVYLFFDRLVRLEICTCQKEWWNLLEGVLLYSPKLRVLKLHQKHSFGIIDPTVRWKEPACVPGCFASHLETFEWRGYEGTEDEKKLASYILRNAGSLKIATIYPVISHPDIRMHGFLRNVMHNELANFAPCFFTWLMTKVSVPVFDGNHYEFWSVKMKTLLKAIDLWDVVETGIQQESPEDISWASYEFVGESNASSSSSAEYNSAASWKQWMEMKDTTALHLIQSGLTNETFPWIASATSSKEAWELLLVRSLGGPKFQARKLLDLKKEYENMTMSEAETVHQFTGRLMELVFRMKSRGWVVEDKEVVKKILFSLPLRFDEVLVEVAETLSISDLIDYLLVHEYNTKPVQEPVIESVDVEESLQAELNHSWKQTLNSLRERVNSSRQTLNSLRERLNSSRITLKSLREKVNSSNKVTQSKRRIRKSNFSRVALTERRDQIMERSVILVFFFVCIMVLCACDHVFRTLIIDA